MHWHSLLLATLLLPTAAVQAADTYLFDTTHCIPEFAFTHLGLTTQTGRFDKIEGQVTLDRASHSGNVDFSIDASSLNMGFGTETPDSAGFRMLRVREFTSIQYHAGQLFFNAQGEVIAAAGQLTLLGVTRPLTVWVNHFHCAPHPLLKTDMCSAEIHATVIRSDFALLDFIPAISDTIQVSVPIEAYRVTTSKESGTPP